MYMKNNRYTRALNSVKVSDETLEKGLKYAMENSDKSRKGKVISMKKSNVTHWKTAAVAACLAAVIGAGGVIRHNFSAKPENSFIITANAEEMEPGTEVIFQFLDTGEGYGRAHDGTDRLSMRQITGLPIRCEGENIESVTYTLDSKTGYNTEQFLGIAQNYKDIVQYENPEDRGGGYRWLPYSVNAMSYTVAYEDQPYFADNGMALDGDRQSWEEPIPVALITQFKVEPSMFGYENFDEWAEATNDLEFRFPVEWYDIIPNPK